VKSRLQSKPVKRKNVKVSKKKPEKLIPRRSNPDIAMYSSYDSISPRSLIVTLRSHGRSFWITEPVSSCRELNTSGTHFLKNRCCAVWIKERTRTGASGVPCTYLVLSHTQA
jgi:hypothetical protein